MNITERIFLSNKIKLFFEKQNVKFFIKKRRHCDHFCLVSLIKGKWGGIFGPAENDKQIRMHMGKVL
ncbi:hypothetical protein BpHYR1_015995 [Brachionus plicatilis]|uniref:Uncharacterized protein n=1 Tax=Brachionus plicatilis TaxID=10195 RepID=A0A3M7PAZ0_BRAPC|nr:hypothetical protein BpHYR1_015995 [Brachionus plicatilis]